MSITLTPDELFEVTGYRQPKKQLEALRKRGIEPIVKPDNSLAVLREWIVVIGTKSKIEAARPQLRAIK